MDGVYVGDDAIPRCRWASAAPEFPDYHDAEWGFPVADDIRLFEKLCLEGFQAGLSWRTILAKREGFRRAFASFDFDVVAGFGEAEVLELLGDKNIVRHRGKIEAVINNARCARRMVDSSGSIAAFVWSYEPDPATLPSPQSVTTLPIAKQMSKDLKKLGWKFVGPTTVYSFMQAMGLVNDHALGCAARSRAETARAAFVSPAAAFK
ncbi:MAG: DNA-3-methyladenine glycosylase I [Myxococcales bacterium]|nr:DNA-3-methyladenine glycosylase I [Myxococcales bacterium]